jgi:hypothetical protein
MWGSWKTGEDAGVEKYERVGRRRESRFTWNGKEPKVQRRMLRGNRRMKRRENPSGQVERLRVL